MGSARGIDDLPIDVLVVDDEPAVCAAVCAVLGAHGYRAESCVSATECFAHLGRVAPRVILLDVHLGATGGIELIEPLRRARPTAKLVLHTGADPGSIDLGGRHVDLVLRKGSIFELLAKLRPLLPAPAGAP